jgi:cytochrome b subunit of formate dehydrogenase
VHQPPAWAVVEWAVWIRPVSDGRTGFDLWFRDFHFLIEMLGGPVEFFLNTCIVNFIWSQIPRPFSMHRIVLPTYIKYTIVH